VQISERAFEIKWSSQQIVITVSLLSACFLLWQNPSSKTSETMENPFLSKLSNSAHSYGLNLTENAQNSVMNSKLGNASAVGVSKIKLADTSSALQESKRSFSSKENSVDRSVIPTQERAADQGEALSQENLLDQDTTPKGENSAAQSKIPLKKNTADPDAELSKKNTANQTMEHKKLEKGSSPALPYQKSTSVQNLTISRQKKVQPGDKFSSETKRINSENSQNTANSLLSARKILSNPPQHSKRLADAVNKPNLLKDTPADSHSINYQDNHHFVSFLQKLLNQLQSRELDRSSSNRPLSLHAKAGTGPFPKMEASWLSAEKRPENPINSRQADSKLKARMHTSFWVPRAKRNSHYESLSAGESYRMQEQLSHPASGFNFRYGNVELELERSRRFQSANVQGYSNNQPLLSNANQELDLSHTQTRALLSTRIQNSEKVLREGILGLSHFNFSKRDRNPHKNRLETLDQGLKTMGTRLSLQTSQLT